LTAYTEDALVEQPAIQRLHQLGWQVCNCFDEVCGDGEYVSSSALYLGRFARSEVVLASRLRAALEKLNPQVPPEAIALAVEELSRDRAALSLPYANREVYKLLKEGVPVSYRDAQGTECFERVQVIDWNEPASNDFFLASQLWITGEVYTRRTDLIGFVNGLPLVLVELKAPQVNPKHAFDDNLRDYKYAIPQVFPYNALVILSNGSDSRIGSLTSEWEHFNDWKKINSEGEEGIISLDTMLHGVCDPARLLDLVENFCLYEEAKGGLRKLIAKNHQYIGVNNALAAVQSMQANQGKLGVFWHTQGSGKSYSMVFFAQKVLRKVPGNWTFLIVTDRTDLDDQIYKNFANCDIVTEAEERVRAGSGEHMQQLLKEDHRFLFTLIQKFHIERGQKYPVISDRSNIIVITDEAHRSQYDVLALNMRNALPNAAFLAFTGTPLMAGEERTRQVFGCYVSIYNFKQSVDDKATVPLFYENRIPELQLTNPNLNTNMADLLDEADLDERQEERLEREFSREYQLITRDDRLEKVAEDLVLHFMSRGFQGKGMVIAIDKLTAVRMYDKVKKHWKIQLAFLQAELETCEMEERAYLEAKIAAMQNTDMAVVVSQGQNEVEDMAQKGVQILPHRLRMVREDLATKFKDPQDPFRLVFVCAMWMTGFDAPSCSTIYLDKPMRNHTLMQTIARANRVFGEKVNGLIVDYIGVFREMQKALAIYGSASGGGLEPGEMPVQPKEALVQALEDRIAETETFLRAEDVDLEALRRSEGFERIHLLDDAVDAMLKNDDTKRDYLKLAGEVDRLFHAILPDLSANRYGEKRKAIVVIAQKIRAEMGPADISGILDQVEDLLDESIAPKEQGYVIRAPVGVAMAETSDPNPQHWVDLSQIDFEALKKKFEKSRKHTQVERLRGSISSKLRTMVQYNRMRMNYYDQFQRLIDEYNAGAVNIDEIFEQLVDFAQQLNAEEQRGISQQLSEEELAVFDLLTQPEPKLNREERKQVRQVAKELLDTLKAERLVLDWRKHQRTRAMVQVAIEEALDQLPDSYDGDLYRQKCDVVYRHVYDAYYGLGKSVYRG
jgi:type I restriction enzyme R subunit